VTPQGGLRDRMIIESHRTMVHGALDALGWFDPNRAHLPINWRTTPVRDDEEIDFNTAILTFEDIDADEIEIGSNVSELTHVVWFDFYGEPAPEDAPEMTYNGGEALGKHFIGDVRAILAGELPDVGRSWPALEVYDWTLATPAAFATLSIENIRTRKVQHHVDKPWQRYWYTCYHELVEDARDIG
jgi:hypothetical protein